MNKIAMNTYKVIKCIENPRKRDYPVNLASEKELKNHTDLDKYKGCCELVGSNWGQSRLYFDYDGYETINNFDQFIEELQSYVLGKEIYNAKRGPRFEEKKQKTKFSRRTYVDNIRLTNTNIPIIFKDLFKKYPELDTSVYDNARVLYLPFTSQKLDTKTNTNFDVPKLEPDNCNAIKCCASWIEETFEDWDALKKDKIILEKLETELHDNKSKFEKIEKSSGKGSEEHDDKIDKLHEIIVKLHSDRAKERGDWMNGLWAIRNICVRNEIRKSKGHELCHLFSAKSTTYDEDGVEKWIDTEYDTAREKGYGWKFLLDWLKEDNPEYYKKLTEKQVLIESANDDIGASKIVVEHYKQSLVICNGVLYVNHNNIWVGNEKQVDKILIEMIGQLDIKFLGADGKRKYSYNTSIKHIRDCIVAIKANQSIINDQFYNNMMKNSKYYLPFNDGIYSFKDKQLYKYDELPNIHFTQKISRNFPKFNQKDHDDLMSRVIIPIYPHDEERTYNAHIKARALAGCYEDKKWYAFVGSRNSGKGVESMELKFSFESFVNTFDAKCLIHNKFGNPDQAKALAWVVDVKNARIIISNEIGADDENAKLNGGFIKTLASGGDEMKGRKLYENIETFIPQFTMFLNCNKLYEFSEEDANENLEQFEYKSKFVPSDELIDGVPFLKLADNSIKEFIKEDRIIDAYTLYILNAFSDPRMTTPQSIKNSTEIGRGEIKLTIENFIMQNFRTTNDNKDRLHTDDITEILKHNNYKVDKISAGRLVNRMGIGKYNNKCNINNNRKGGYDFIKYIGNDDEV